MPYLHRVLEDRFLELSGFFKVVLLTGARQTGKTTMLQHLAEGTGRSYATLDEPLVRETAKKDPVAFFQQFPPPVMIDEVQYAPELFPVIKLLADRSGSPGQFWLTGSQQYSMMVNVRESLAGRVGILRMHGLTQGEKAQTDGSPLQLDISTMQHRAAERSPAWGPGSVPEHVWLGCMPGLNSAEAVSTPVRDAFFSSYVETYLMRDVANLSGVQDLVRFQVFLRACAALAGQQVNYANLTDTVGISQPTARRWLDLLVGLDIVYLLPPFSNNALKRLAKTPKLYFTDTGLAAYLGKWPSSDTLWNGAAGGALFENAVISDLRATLSAGTMPFDMTYYRDSNKTEIDLMLEMGGLVHPLEIKKGSRPRGQEIRKFEALDRAGLQRGNGGIICTAPGPVLIDRQNAYIPSWIL